MIITEYKLFVETEYTKKELTYRGNENILITSCPMPGKDGTLQHVNISRNILEKFVEMIQS